MGNELVNFYLIHLNKNILNLNYIFLLKSHLTPEKKEVNSDKKSQDYESDSKR